MNPTIFRLWDDRHSRVVSRKRRETVKEVLRPVWLPLGRHYPALSTGNEDTQAGCGGFAPRERQNGKFRGSVVPEICRMEEQNRGRHVEKCFRNLQRSSLPSELHAHLHIFRVKLQKAAPRGVLWGEQSPECRECWGVCGDPSIHARQTSLSTEGICKDPREVTPYCKGQASLRVKAAVFLPN